MSAQFPFVPPLPGVPPLARQAAYSVTAAEITSGGIQQLINIQLGLANTEFRFGTNPSSPGPMPPGALPSYGFFQELTISPITTTVAADGTLVTQPGNAIGDYSASPLLQPDSVMEFAVNADSSINSHPIEQGGFSAYNRVQEPISIRMRLACMGKLMTRRTFVSTLQSLREGTTVLTIATPDRVYKKMALKGFGYKKTSDQGFVTIWADTQWQEERSTNVTVSAPPTISPQGAATSNLGSLQATTPSTQAQSIISNPPTVPAALPSAYANTQPASGSCF